MATHRPAKRAKMLPVPVNFETITLEMASSEVASSEVVLPSKGHTDHMKLVKKTQNYSYSVPAGTLPPPPDELLQWLDEIIRDPTYGVVQGDRLMRTLTKDGYLDAYDNLVPYPPQIQQYMDTVSSNIVARIKEDFGEEVVDIASKMYYMVSRQRQQYFHVDLVEDSFQVAIACSDNQLPTQHIPHEYVLSASQALKNLGLSECSKEKMSFSWCVANRSAELALTELEKEEAWQKYVKARRKEDISFAGRVNKGGYSYTPCKGCHRGPVHDRGKVRKILLLTFSVGINHKHYDGTQSIGSVHALVDQHMPWKSENAENNLEKLTFPCLAKIKGQNLIHFYSPFADFSFAQGYVDALTRSTRTSFKSLFRKFKIMLTLYEEIYLSEEEHYHKDVHSLMLQAHRLMQKQQHVVLLQPSIALKKVEQQMKDCVATFSQLSKQFDAPKLPTLTLPTPELPTQVTDQVHSPEVLKRLWPQFSRFASPVCCKTQKPACLNSKIPFAQFYCNRKNYLQFYCADCLPRTVPNKVHPLFQNAHTLPIRACFDLFVQSADKLLPPDWGKGNGKEKEKSAISSSI